MFCKHCGAQNNDNAKFCAVCGAKTEIGSSIGEVTNNTIAYNQESGNVESDKKQSKLGKIVNGIISFIAASYLLGSLVGLFEKSPIPFLVFIGIEFLLEIIKHKFPKIPEPLIFAVEIIILIICINSANAAGVVNSVKKGSPKNNPNVTYEEAFDNFFANAEWKSAGKDDEGNKLESSPNLCVNSSFSYVVLPTLLLSSRDLTEWSLVYHNTLSYQRFYDLHSIHYDHLEGLHQLI